jgi:hypothetical protein
VTASSRPTLKNRNRLKKKAPVEPMSGTKLDHTRQLSHGSDTSPTISVCAHTHTHAQRTGAPRPRQHKARLSQNSGKQMPVLRPDSHSTEMSINPAMRPMITPGILQVSATVENFSVLQFLPIKATSTQD